MNSPESWRRLEPKTVPGERAEASPRTLLLWVQLGVQLHSGFDPQIPPAQIKKVFWGELPWGSAEQEPGAISTGFS